MRLGIDASNLKAGGGLVHLREILSAAEPDRHGISEVLIWGGRDTLRVLPQRAWLRPIWLPQCDQNIVSRSIWQTRVLPRLATGKIDLLFSPGGTHIGAFRPYVTMIRNWLLFDRYELMRYGLSRQVLRLELLRYLQIRTLRDAAGVIFLTEYSRDKVRPKMKSDTSSVVIPHGVSAAFRFVPKPQLPITQYSIEHPFQFLYVSWVEPYKEQLKLVRAVAKLRAQGCPVTLQLAGAGEARSVAELKALISNFDPEGKFLHYHGPVQYPEIAELYRQADAFVFPSSCETFGMPLLEAMAAGLPVASSNKAVMPEVVADAGVLFSPEVEEIAVCLRELVEDVDLRQKCAMASTRRAERFTWARTADATFAYLADTWRRSQQTKVCQDSAPLVLQR